MVFLLFFLQMPASANTVVKEMNRIAGEVAALELGFGSYILGKPLTAEQKVFAQKHPVAKALKGTYKFQDEKIFVIAAKENDLVLGVYREYPDVSTDDLKGIVGTLMLEHGEPTAIAHEKLVYWSYGKNGKITQEDFDFARQSGGMKSLVAVKFSSSQEIGANEDSVENPKDDRAKEQSPISAYVMITSDPLSKLFLANTKRDTK